MERLLVFIASKLYSLLDGSDGFVRYQDSPFSSGVHDNEEEEGVYFGGCDDTGGGRS